ncbi:unnamed protein product [Paramecium octaurelia]|uniref:Uncharacterized protein n=1 Tax=Paramecium octaurelia TaxID=43137 RepID=A0A8S1SDH1_PAROT|nr:unnamed protein product [Paramecium octaurelia]
MQYVDDMVRVKQLAESWQKKKSLKLLKSRLSSAKNPQRTLSRVPHLIRNYNTVEQNIFAVSKLNKTFSHIYNSPKENQKQTSLSFSVDEAFYQFPSKSNTKKENQMVIDKIQYQFQIFKQKNQSKISKKTSFQPKASQTFSRNSISIQNQAQQSQSSTINNNLLVNQRTVLKNGVKYPYQLLIMNDSRQKILNSMINSNDTTLLTISNAGDLDELKKKDSQVYQNEVKTVQNEKRKQELLSRNYMTNAMYSLMALNRRSQSNVKTKYQTLLPRDSRFYMI